MSGFESLIYKLASRKGKKILRIPEKILGRGIPNVFVKEKPWGWVMSCDIYAAEKGRQF